MNNVALVNKDQMDLPVFLAEMEIQEHLATMEHLAALVLMLRSETNCCLYHHNVLVPQLLDLLDHLDNEAMMDHLETMDHLEMTDDLVEMDPLDHLDSLDNLDDLETKDHPENPELFVPDKPRHQAHLDNLADPDNLDSPADLENPVKMVTTEDPANLAALETVDHPDVMANQEDPENLATPDLQEVVTTVHQHVWLTDIRTTTHYRGPLIFSYYFVMNL